MAQRYYSPSTRSFYSEARHGARLSPKPLTPREAKAGRRPEMVPNPDCRIPADAVAVSEAAYAELMAAQARGMVIVPGRNGPEARPHEPDEAERQASRRARRDRMLAASDWTQLPDATPPGGRAAWAEYRQALRDLDMAGADWPSRPGAVA